MNLTKYQEATFNEIINLKHDIQLLAGFVQNDFQRMLDDGVITQKELENSLSDVDNQFNNFIKKVECFKNKVNNIVHYYSFAEVKNDYDTKMVQTSYDTVHWKTCSYTEALNDYPYIKFLRRTRKV